MTDRNASLGEAEKLLLCPFCGGDAVMGSPTWTALQSFEVECSECGASVPIEPSPELAQSHWNTRAPISPSFKDGIEAAAKVVEEFVPLDINRFVVNGEVVKDHKGNELFFAKDEVNKAFHDKIAAIRALSSEGGSDAPVNVKGE